MKYICHFILPTCWWKNREYHGSTPFHLDTLTINNFLQMILVVIRPMTSNPHTRNIKKSDPVSRYQQYRQSWDSSTGSRREVTQISQMACSRTHVVPRRSSRKGNSSHHQSLIKVLKHKKFCDTSRIEPILIFVSEAT